MKKNYWLIISNFWQTLRGPFSAVSTLISKQVLIDQHFSRLQLLHPFAPLQSISSTNTSSTCYVSCKQKITCTVFFRISPNLSFFKMSVVNFVRHSLNSKESVKVCREVRKSLFTFHKKYYGKLEKMLRA